MKPHSADCVKEAAMFTSMWPEGLKEAEIFAKSLKVRREPEDGQLALLAKAQLRRAPRWPIMCLKALMSAPECFCKWHGQARLFTSSDTIYMETKLMPQILEATGIVDKARSWLDTDKENHTIVTANLLGDMEVRLVMHVHGFAKRVKSRTQFKSLEAIGQQFAFDVEKAGGDMKRSPWKPHNSHGGAAESANRAAKDSRIPKLDKDRSINSGELSVMFGMDLGSTVQLKDKKNAGGIIYHIDKIEDRAVTLIANTDSSMKTVTPGELADLYQPCKLAEDIVLRSAKFMKLEQHGESTMGWVKSCAKLLLYEAFRLHQPKVNVAVKLTPSLPKKPGNRNNKHRHVLAGEKYEAGQLKLVPYSPILFNAAVEGKEKTPLHNRFKLRFG